MKNLIILILSISFLKVSGQTWYQDGDQWVNQIHAGYFGGLNGFEEIEVDGDTIVADQSYKKLTSKFALHVLGGDTLYEFTEPYLLREENDSVFHRYNGQEYLIYDFTMEVGDTLPWNTDEFDNACPSFFRLDSIYDKVIDGDTIKVQRGFVYSNEVFFDRFIQIYETVGAVDSKIAPFNGEWYAGFFIPRTGLSCYADYIPPTLCQFTSKDIKLKEEDGICYEISSSTQDWFYEDGEWVYNFGGMFDPQTYARILNHEPSQDTIINNETYKLVSNRVASLSGSSELSYYEEDPYIMRSEDRKLYYWTGDTTHLVYDFNMSLGDSIQWYPDHGGVDTMENCRSFFVLDSLSIDTIYQNEYHVQHGRLTSDFWEEETKIEIYESIGWVRSYDAYNGNWGSSGFLIPELNLACYYDGVGQGSFCQYTSRFGNRYPIEETDCFNLVSSAESPKIDLEIKIAPNPVVDHLRIMGDLSAFEKYSIYNINGQLVSSSDLNNTSINTSEIQSGIYYLRLLGTDGLSQTLKFSKVE